MDALLRRRAMMGLSNGRLPSGYTEVAYIQNTTNAYIDTGIVPPCTWKIKAAATSTPLSSGIVLGTKTSQCHWFAAKTNGLWGSLNNIDGYNNTDESQLSVVINVKSIVYAVGSSQAKTDTTTVEVSTSVWLFAASPSSSNTFPFLGRIIGDVIATRSGNEIFYGVCCISPNNEVGLYDLISHSFFGSSSEGTFVAGSEIERQLTHFFSGKNLAIIGDSISTYNADGYKYDSYSMYYPYGEVNSVEYTYWKKLMNDENATLEVNLSYSGSCACSRSGYVSLNDRIGLIGNANTVIIALGTNDSAQSKPLGDYLYDTPYSDLGEANFREAYIKGIKGLLAANPNLIIVCAIFSMGADYRNSITEIAQHYGLKCIDCGDNYAKVQGVHPNIAGMIEIEKHFLYD